MNAISSLGITVLHCNGEPTLTSTTSELKLASPVARVSLVESVVILSQKGCYIKAHVDCDGHVTDDLLFEPRHETLSALGVCAKESLVHKREDGMIPELSGHSCAYRSWSLVR